VAHLIATLYLFSGEEKGKKVTIDESEKDVL
jgi:hypothetical protein